jgi:putative ABC transport system permease protein
MRKVVTAWNRFRTLFRRRGLERDLDDELAFHLAMREREYRERGLTTEAASAEARRAFGNLTQFKERTRDAWVFPSLESVRQDVHYAFRTIRRSPGFSAVAIFALALAIGGTTTIFSLVDAARARALPYEHPGRLVVLWGNVLRNTVERRGASYPDFLDWREHATTLGAMAAFDGGDATLATGEPARIGIEAVSAPYFRLLGMRPALGRTFLPDEDEVGGKAVAVLGDGLWKGRFGGDPSIIGRTVVLDSRPFTVVGVMPPGFKGLTDSAEAWIPFVASDTAEGLAARGRRWFRVLARMEPHVTPQQVQADLDAISRRLERAHPDTNSKRGVEVSALDVELFGDVRPALRALMAAVVFVLLIACANVSNLLIARSEARQREIAVRAALGAGWGRLLRQLMTEGCVLAGTGAAAGLLVARAAVPALLAASPVSFPSFAEPSVNPRVAAFTVAVSLACGILLGLAPAAHARVSRLPDALKDSARGTDGRRAYRLRSALVVGEVALAVVLLVGAGLMIQSVRNLSAVDPGFDARSVLSLRISVPSAGSTAAVSPGANATAGPGATPSRAAATGQAPAPAVPALVGPAHVILDRIRAVPGVAAASLASDIPLTDGSAAVFFTAEGQPPVTAQTVPRAYVHRVTPEFFSTMRIPFESGRTFLESELTPASPAVVVSARLARRFWRGEDPAGKRIKLGGLTSTNPWLSIVGVVRETRYRGLPENPTADPDIYFPFLDRATQVSIAVRADVDPSSLVPSLRAAIRSVDASIPVFNISLLADRVASQTAASRFTMWLMGVFAAVALLLAVVGIYGVMAYLVTRRTGEIGIRLALGAGGRDVLRLIVGNGASMICLGLAAGVAASLALQRFVSSLLFGVSAAGVTSGAAVALLAVVALAACYLPALRATKVDPLHALRHE